MLRQLALRWLAVVLTQQPQRHRSGGQVHDGGQDRERVVVALRGTPDGQMLIRRAARIAVGFGADLLAMHITRPGRAAAAAATAMFAAQH